MIPSTNEGGNPSSGTARSCSTTPITAVVGVSRIWTLASYRRRNIASRLLDAMRSVTFFCIFHHNHKRNVSFVMFPDRISFTAK